MNSTRAKEIDFVLTAILEDQYETVCPYDTGDKWVIITPKNPISNEEEGVEKEIYALLDAADKPFCIFEISLKDDKITHMRGIQNGWLISSLLSQHFKKRIGGKHMDSKSFNLYKSGMIEINGVIYSLDELPENLKVNGDLRLPFFAVPLPKNLEVSGHLDLSYSKIAKLPDGLKVGGHLGLYGTNITTLPKDIHIGGGLSLSHSKITELPDGLDVRGPLNLSYTQIKKLPKGLKVGGYLNLANSEVTELSEGIKVSGSMDLSNSHITVLPEGLTVEGDLYLSHSKITTLPEKLNVGRNVNLCGSEIASLPDNLVINGNLDLSYTKITQLPKNMKVQGVLNLINCDNLLAIPEDLSARRIYINYFQYINIPANLKDKVEYRHF